MPLHDVSNSARLRNKQNTSQVDPQSCLANQLFKQQLQKSSPSKNFLSKQVKQMTQLKILLSDRQFQLKRLEEDCSVKLAMMQKQLTKEKNQKKQLMKEWKERMEEDRQYFQVKIVGVEDTWKGKMTETEDRVRGEMTVQFDKKVKLMKGEHQAILSQMTKKMQQLQSQHQSSYQSLITVHKQQLSAISLNFAQQLLQLTQRSQQQLTQLKQQHLSQTQFYHQLQQQKVKQNNTVVKILSQKIKKMQEELRVNKQRVQQLKKEISFKEEELLVQKRAKQEYRLDKVYLERKLMRLEPDVKNESQKQLAQAKLQYQSLLQGHTKKFTQQLVHLRSLHDQSTSNYQHQLQQMQQRCLQVTLLHQTIKSNEQDLRKIQTLQMKLIKKQMQLQKQKEDVKMCKLQLNNMDQIFHKMFQQAKLKSLKPKRNRLPSLLSVGQNRSTMDVYGNVNEGASKEVTTNTKERKKFSIREVNYQSVHNKAREVRELQSQFAPYE